MRSVAQQWQEVCTAAGRRGRRKQDELCKKVWAAPTCAQVVLMKSWCHQALSQSGGVTTSLTPQPGALALHSCSLMHRKDTIHGRSGHDWGSACAEGWGSGQGWGWECLLAEGWRCSGQCHGC